MVFIHEICLNLKNYSLSLTLDYMQDIFVSERGYMPKIQVSHRIRVNRLGILYIYIYIYIYNQYMGVFAILPICWRF
jgi:hypothetical protein